jgi:hypothetical protein
MKTSCKIAIAAGAAAISGAIAVETLHHWVQHAVNEAVQVRQAVAPDTAKDPHPKVLTIGSNGGG